MSYEIVNALKDLGLSLYEAKAYLCLLKNGNSYGGELSKKSGVPTSKIYETLNKLVEKGMVYPINSNPVYYQALPLKHFLNKVQKQTSETVSFLMERQQEIESKDMPELLWHLTGKERVLAKSIELIEKATRFILISFWPEEFEELITYLQGAASRNIDVISIQMGEKTVDIGTTYRHRPGPMVHERHASEMFLTIDNEEGMFSYLDQYQDWKGYFSSSKEITRIIENYIRHDIYINSIIEENLDYFKTKYLVVDEETDPVIPAILMFYSKGI